MRRPLSRAVTSLSTPPIPEVQGWAAEYDGRLGPLANFSQAVPGYAPHPDLFNWAAETASSSGASGYGLIEGDTELISAFPWGIEARLRADDDCDTKARCP